MADPVGVIDNDEGDLLNDAKTRWKEADELMNDLRETMQEDAAFENGDQWPQEVLSMRNTDPHGPRPTITINKAAVHRRNVTNQIRQARPQIRVNPVDDRADPKTASMLNGLLRQIQSTSAADLAYDTACRWQVTCGLGYFGIGTRVVDEAVNQQEVIVLPKPNPFSIRMDPWIEDECGKDAEYCFEDELHGRAQLKKQYGKAGEQATSWEGEDPNYNKDDRRVKTTRYWWREQDKGPKLLLLTDGSEFSEDEYRAMHGDNPGRPDVLGERRSQLWRVYWAHMAGNHVFEQHEFPAEHIPIIRVVGEETWIDGKRDIKGLTRDMIDPCRMYNYWASLYTETVALQPKIPWVAPAEAIEGYEDDYAAANRSNMPYLRYNHMDEAGNPLPPPQRQAGATLPPGIVQGMMFASDDIKSASGQFNESMGNESNASSGRAIRARQQEGQIATYHFVDNLGRSMRHAGSIILEMIPRLYDTPRIARILGEDGDVTHAQINPAMNVSYTQGEPGPDGKYQPLYNPGVGKYDVVVSVGPSYQTRRQEQAEAMSDILQANPALWQIIGDKLVRAMDWPDAQDMAERIKLFLPPEVQELEAAREQGIETGRNQADQIRQGLIAEIAPRVEQMQMALEQAGMEIEQRDQAISQLQLQLEDKSAEFAIKQAEIEGDIQEENIKAEAEVVKAYLETFAQQQSPEGGETVVEKASEQTEEVKEGVEQVAQNLAGMQQERGATIDAVMKYLASDQSEEALEFTVREIAEVHSGGYINDIIETHKDQGDAQLKDNIAAIAEGINQIAQGLAGMQRERDMTKDAVMEYFASDQSEDALEATINKIDRVH